MDRIIQNLSLSGHLSNSAVQCVTAQHMQRAVLHSAGLWQYMSLWHHHQSPRWYLIPRSSSISCTRKQVDRPTTWVSPYRMCSSVGVGRTRQGAVRQYTHTRSSRIPCQFLMLRLQQIPQGFSHETQHATSICYVIKRALLGLHVTNSACSLVTLSPRTHAPAKTVASPHC